MKKPFKNICLVTIVQLGLFMLPISVQNLNVIHTEKLLLKSNILTN
jgi:hypothetical protein